MNKFFLRILFFSIFFNSSVFPQKSEEYYLKKVGFSKIELKKKDTIVFLVSNSITKVKKPTVIFLQGSLPLPLIFQDSSDVNTIFPFDINKYLEKFNFVLIGRKGIPLVGSYDRDSNGYLDEKGKIPLDYSKNDNLMYRTFQVKQVINHLHKQKWVQKDSVFLIGHSEGYRVAAKASENNKKIAKLVCMSANPFNRSCEQIFRERIKTISENNDSVFQSNIDLIIKDFKNIGSDIGKSKNDYELYNWISYEKSFAYESLLKFPNPILVTYGSEDFGSLHNDLLPFLLRNKELTLITYPDLDHNYFKKEFDKNGKRLEDSYHWDEIFNDIQKWLTSEEKK